MAIIPIWPCEQGHALGPGTKAMYTPLIDMTPSDPTTMMTAIVSAQRVTEETRQVYILFVADQQLYRVMVNVDQYNDFSIKSTTRNARAGKQASRHQQFTPDTPLPPQQVILTVAHKKLQLISGTKIKLIETVKHLDLTYMFKYSNRRVCVSNICQ